MEKKYWIKQIQEATVNARRERIEPPIIREQRELGLRRVIKSAHKFGLDANDVTKALHAGLEVARHKKVLVDKRRLGLKNPLEND